PVQEADQEDEHGRSSLGASRCCGWEVVQVSHRERYVNELPIPLFGIGNKARSVSASAQDRLNLYVEVNQDPEKHVLTMYPTAGLASFVNFGAFPSRGGYQKGNFQYIVNRNKLWKVAND